MNTDAKLKKVADNIRAARLLRNYSQDYLAIQLRISQNAYSKIELGYTRLTYERLVEIAEILNYSPHDLLPAAFVTPRRDLFLRPLGDADEPPGAGPLRPWADSA